MKKIGAQILHSGNYKQYGCSPKQVSLDRDMDGVLDEFDLCPKTNLGDEIDDRVVLKVNWMMIKMELSMILIDVLILLKKLMLMNLVVSYLN